MVKSVFNIIVYKAFARIIPSNNKKKVTAKIVKTTITTLAQWAAVQGGASEPFSHCDS